MNKILIIGQAPPAVNQEFPYDTTQLYDWIREATNISHRLAQEKFIFEAMVPTFTGRNRTNSGHKRPLKADMVRHYNVVLLPHLLKAKKVIVLGGVAASFLGERISLIQRLFNQDLEVLYIIHPSMRNVHKFRQNRETIIQGLRDIILKDENIIR